jgi:hypothetical protein
MSPQPRRRPARRSPDSEAAFQARVIGLARYYDWLVYHAPAGGKGGRVDFEQRGRGFPDLVLLKAPRLIVAELKPEKAKRRPGVTDAEVATRPEWLRHVDLTADQARWLEAIDAVGDAIDIAARMAAAPMRRASAPAVEAHVWRPSDLEAIVGILGPRADDPAGVAFARSFT